MSLAVVFGREISKARKEAGLNQEALAFRAGVHRTYISQLELGKKSPSLKTFFKLCEALDIAPEELIVRVHQQIENPSRDSET